jgi:hypothetical protein
MTAYNTGDRVRVVTREQTAKDVRENTYFPHLAGLTGTVAKVYSPEEVCVTVDRESLPEKNAIRHVEIQTSMQEKWLDSISQDSRSKLTEREKEFHLHYSIIMNSADLEPLKPGAAIKDQPESEAPVVHEKDLDVAEEEYLKSRVA